MRTKYDIKYDINAKPDQYSKEYLLMSQDKVAYAKDGKWGDRPELPCREINKRYKEFEKLVAELGRINRKNVE